MIDIKLIRDDPDIIKGNLLKRNATELLPLVDEAIERDRRWRELKLKVDQLRHLHNKITEEIAELKRRNIPAEEKLSQARKIPEQIRSLEEEADREFYRVKQILMKLPNILHETVPVGKDENDNVTIRVWGEKPMFHFEPRDHIDVLKSLDLVDVERAAKISGSRFFFLKGEAVKLEHALMRYAISILEKKGFTLLEPPFMMRKEPYEGVVDLSDFGPVIYKVENEDLYLIATSEHPLVSMYMDEILNGSDLPLKYCGFSPCFRVEAGSHGKDTKGIFRTHQFYKVEQIIFSRPEESWDWHEKMISYAEEIFRGLGLHYRIVNVCTGDIGSVAAKKYDLEAWMPAQGRYREMVSCSNCTDYQARRLRIRFRDKQSEQTRFVHTLNSTAITTRALVAVAENFQQEDGSIAIPKVLQPYMDGKELIKASMGL
jgi:seryl-tRNA synthetase